MKKTTGCECASNRRSIRKQGNSALLNKIIADGSNYEFEEKLPAIAKYSKSQIELYQSGDKEKIALFCMHYLFCEEVQRQIVKDENYIIADFFLAYWDFNPQVQYSLTKKSSARFVGFCISYGGVCSEAQINLTKRSEMKKILVRYHQKWVLCEKAYNICCSALKLF